MRNRDPLHGWYYIDVAQFRSQSLRYPYPANGKRTFVSLVLTKRIAASGNEIGCRLGVLIRRMRTAMGVPQGWPTAFPRSSMHPILQRGFPAKMERDRNIRPRFETSHRTPIFRPRAILTKKPACRLKASFSSGVHELRVTFKLMNRVFS